MEKSVLGQESLSCSELDCSVRLSRSSSSIQTEPTTELTMFIEKLCPILNEIKGHTEIAELPAVEKAIESLDIDYKRAKAAMDDSSVRSSPVKRIEDLTQNLGRSLGLVLFASHEMAFCIKDKIEALCKEMMNVRFESNSDRDSDFVNEAVVMEEMDDDEEEEEETEEEYDTETDEKDEDEIVEDSGTCILGIDDIFALIRSDDEEKFKKALLGLNGLIMDGMVSNEKLDDEDVVKILHNRLSSCESPESVMIIRLLRYLVSVNGKNKEKMMGSGLLSALVNSLSRDAEERTEAVGLLSNLCSDPGVRRQIGRIQGCVSMLVAISNGDDEAASHDARILLNAMSGNTQHTISMAEAGYFKPLIICLREGSDMSKVLMATALSRMELTDQNKISLGKDGAIDPLVKMFSTGNLEAKLSSLNALQTLSTLKQNIQLLNDSGIVASLLELLFSVTSILMTLREPASAILAKVSKSESILVRQDIAQQMFSLLNLSSPVIQNHLLEALNNITSHANASKVRKKMRENGAVHLLVPFFTEADASIRAGALKLVYTLSKDMPDELIDQLRYSRVNIIANIISSSTSKCEKAAAFGILSNLPVNDKKITEILKNANLMHLLVSAMSFSHANSTPTVVWMAESIAGILIRFTVPTDKRLQHYSVENGVIPILLKLLTSSSHVAKCKASLCLAQLSQNSLKLRKSQKLKWFCIPPSIDSFCEVHGGYCTVKSTFCLIKAGAIASLIQILDGDERGSDEAVLSCLATLLQDETWEGGSGCIVKMKGVNGIIKVLEFGSLKSREKALWLLERIFGVEAYRAEYGESAKTVLKDLARSGDPTLKPSVGKLLAQLEVFQDQSS